MATFIGAQGEVLATARYQMASMVGANFQQNTQGALLAALSLPLNAEVVRLGNSYVAGSTTDIAPVAALPTTAAHFAIWNGEAAGTGKSYVIHTCGYICSTSAAAILQESLIAHVSTVATTAPSVTAGLGPKSLSGRVAQSAATIGSAVTITNNGVWHVVANQSSQNFGAQTPTIGLAMAADTNGLYIIPPGGTFSLAVMCQAAASAKNQLFVTWSEVQIALG